MLIIFYIFSQKTICMKNKIWTVYTISLQGNVMYVGKTYRFVNRKWSHLNKRGTNYSAIPVDIDLLLVTFDQVKEFNNEVEALKYEDELILKYDTLAPNGWNKLRSGLIKTGNLKEYQRISSQRFRELNPDKIKEYTSQYYKQNKEKCNTRCREYYQTHKEERHIKDKIYREAHKEERKQKQREWWGKNKDIINARRREERRRKKKINNDLKILNNIT